MKHVESVSDRLQIQEFNSKIFHHGGFTLTGTSSPAWCDCYFLREGLLQTYDRQSDSLWQHMEVIGQMGIQAEL